MAITRGRTIDRDLEKRILTSMIVSTQVLQHIRPIYRSAYFELVHCQKVGQWIVDYFDAYREAPYLHFKDIFSEQKQDLSPQELEIVEDFLVELSEKFVEDEGINEQYVIDQAKGYFKKQGLIRKAKEALTLAEAGDVDAAELVFSDFKEISVKTSEWVAPFADFDFMRESLNTDSSSVMELDTIGSLIGGVKPGWLVSFLGPMKRGKTWALQNLAMDLLTRKKKVAVVSLEMDKLHLAPRYYMQMGDFIYAEQHEIEQMKVVESDATWRHSDGKDWIESSYKKKATVARIPVFDCVKNRNDACRKGARCNYAPFPGMFEDGMRSTYQPCSACRYTSESRDFEPVVWWYETQKEILTSDAFEKAQWQFKTNYPAENLRMISYPAYSANLNTVRQALDLLEYTEGFVPDAILFDYADILAPEDPRIIGRDAIDLTWKSLKNLAASRSCLVVTASQAGRRALASKTVETTDTSDDIRKLAHVDCMIGLNQTAVEKDAGIMRLTCLAHRWSPSSVNRVLTTLQSLRTGKFFLDGLYNVASFDKMSLYETRSVDDGSEES